MTVAALLFYYLSALSLCVVAVVQVISLVVSLRDRRDARESQAVEAAADQRVTLGTEYWPAACGVASTSGECVRRRGHLGRCATELQVEQLLETPVPRQSTAPVSDVSVDVAALGRHVDACPLRVTLLDEDEQKWLMRTRVMVESLASGEKFSEWGETRG